MSTFDAATLVDLQRYPLQNLHNTAGKELVKSCRETYMSTGLCALPEFILPAALTQLADEANALAPEAWFCRNTHNAYLDDGDDTFPESDAANRQESTYVGSVPFDRIKPETRLRTLYQWDPLMDFIGAVLDKESFYRFADPFGACSINVFVDGGAHGWHFDESEFTVTLMLQPPERGGSFEYLPGIRGQHDEKERVAATLDGDRRGVVTLPFTAGTLLIFGGRQTLHRVTRVEGSKSRLVPVLCYAEEPNLTNSESVRQLFWGRVGPEDQHA